jgi:hypothetical protein
MDGQIFISYRRDESQAWAGRISDRLDSQLGADRIFNDVDKIDYGVDFIDEIEKRVRSYDALIAVIGRNWLISAGKEGRRRLDKPEDFCTCRNWDRAQTWRSSDPGVGRWCKHASIDRAS